MGFDFSSFEFKVSEMLKEVELGYGETVAVDRAVSAVRDCIDAISDQTVSLTAERYVLCILYGEVVRLLVT